MGTSVVEAAFCKVPAIVALAHDGTGFTYGSIYMHPEGSCGDFMDTPPNSTIRTEIKRLLDMSAQDYEIEADRGYSHVRCFELEAQMRRFVELANQATPVKRATLLFLSYYVYSGLRRLLDAFSPSRRTSCSIIA
jgi:hypothetical protein